MEKAMANSNLADRFDLSDLEPEVDEEAAKSFLSEDKRKSKQTKERKPRSNESNSAEVPKPQLMIAETWTTRTVRLRQTTATALTKATYAQRTKQADGKLMIGDPVTVQEIADRGIRLALTELGYLK